MWEQKVLLIQKWEQILHDNIPTCYTCSDDHGFKSESGRSGLSFWCLITGTDSYSNEHVLVASWPGRAFNTHNPKANTGNASGKR